MLLIQRPKKSLCEVPAGRPKGIPNYRRYRALNAPTPRIRQSDLKIVILCLLGAGFSVALMVALTHNRVDGTDFLSFYAGGRLAATGHLYTHRRSGRLNLKRLAGTAQDCCLFVSRVLRSSCGRWHRPPMGRPESFGLQLTSQRWPQPSGSGPDRGS